MKTQHATMLVGLTMLVTSIGCSKDAERGSRNAPSESASPVAPSAIGATTANSSGRLRLRSPGITRAVEFPPRDEPFAFRSNDLEAKYRDGLHRSPNSSYVDIEGTIVWTQEYLRYRVNLCDHEEAIQKVFAQIDGGGVQPTCGNAPPGQVGFPPRDQPFDFRTRLEMKYRDQLRRTPTTTYVDVEGDIVWTQEYLRYRVSGCGHPESVQKVMAQIDGAGVQPDCTPATPPPTPNTPVARFVMRQDGRRTDTCNLRGDVGTCTFDGRSSTAPSAITRYAWKLQAGPYEPINKSGATVEYRIVCIVGPNTAYAVRVALTIRTQSGQTASTTQDFTLARANCGA